MSGFAYYCICGDSMTGEVSPDSALDGLGRAFDAVHSGEGHGRTDRHTAHAARRGKRRTRPTPPTTTPAARAEEGS